MTNTYEPAGTVSTDTRIAQGRFLETHHHLINQRFYTAEQISTKDTLLLRSRWREHDRKVWEDFVAGG